MDVQNLAFVAIVFLVMIFLNRVLAVPQQLRLNKELMQLKRKGPASSVGLAKSIWGSRIAVLIAEKDGRITEAYYVRGKSITSSYCLDKSFPYNNCYEAKSELEKKARLSTQERAYLSAVTYLEEGLPQRD